jgi:hypothetical protein
MALAAAPPPFHFHAIPVAPALRRRMTGRSWHRGCPVGIRRLRDVRLGFWGFDRHVHRGRVVVNVKAVPAVRRVFARLYARRFPIRHLRLVDAYRGSDFRSIEADNTSAFNCRRATGSQRWSQHAYGLAVDVNPIENPYVYADGTTTHPASRPYLDRADVRPGMAVPGGPLVNAFDAAGWGWGGRWTGARDYQHFSRNGH